MLILGLCACAAFVVGSPKGDLGHLADLLPKIGLLKVTFLFKSLLSERRDDGGVLPTLFVENMRGYWAQYFKLCLQLRAHCFFCREGQKNRVTFSNLEGLLGVSFSYILGLL